MKPIYLLLKNYTQSNFHLKAFLSILIFTSILIGFNYTFNFEDDYVDRVDGNFYRFLGMFFFQGLPYIITLIILSFYKLIPKWWNNKQFWFVFVFGFSLLALDRSVFFSDEFSKHIKPLNYLYFFKIVNFLSGLVFIIIPLLIFGYFFNKDNKSFGLLNRFKGVKPYLILLGFGILCVLIGGFFGDIQKYYPLYAKIRPENFQSHSGWSNWLTVLVFESSYALSFISVELFFRGFLIFAFVRFFGPYVVLPMAITYCVLHFGKPMTETISSIFGGYILGIVSLKHKNIQGGIIVHMGMALCMELIGYLYRTY